METIRTREPHAFARQIALTALGKGWRKGDCIHLCGGGATTFIDALKGYFDDVRLIDADPTFANVKSFYMIARRLYE